MVQRTFQYEFRGPSFGRGRITHAVQRLILANVVILAAELIMYVALGYPVNVFHPPSASSTPFMRWVAFDADLFLSGAVWQPFTYMFLHEGLMHLFMNMLVLFFFGPEVERALSTRQFYRFFLFCGAVGVMGSLGSSFVRRGITPGYDPAHVLGASGAVMGVLMAFAMVQPRREIYLFPFPVPIHARGLVIIIVLLNIFWALTDRHISWETHMGGLAAGYVYMKGAPWVRARLDRRRRGGERRPEDPVDEVGKAVDNIFTFEDERRRRK